MFRAPVVIALLLVVCSNRARANELPVAGYLPAEPIRAAIAHVRFDASDNSRSGIGAPSKRNSTATKVTAGVALGIAGLFGGAWIGAKLEGNCVCDDPGLKGMIIGAPIGAIAGAITGVWLASR